MNNHIAGGTSIIIQDQHISSTCHNRFHIWTTGENIELNDSNQLLLSCVGDCILPPNQFTDIPVNVKTLRFSKSHIAYCVNPDNQSYSIVQGGIPGGAPVEVAMIKTFNPGPDDIHVKTNELVGKIQFLSKDAISDAVIEFRNKTYDLCCKSFNYPSPYLILLNSVRNQHMSTHLVNAKNRLYIQNRRADQSDELQPLPEFELPPQTVMRVDTGLTFIFPKLLRGVFRLNKNPTGSRILLMEPQTVFGSQQESQERLVLKLYNAGVSTISVAPGDHWGFIQLGKIHDVESEPVILFR